MSDAWQASATNHDIRLFDNTTTCSCPLDGGGPLSDAPVQLAASGSRPAPIQITLT